MSTSDEYLYNVVIDTTGGAGLASAAAASAKLDAGLKGVSAAAKQAKLDLKAAEDAASAAAGKMYGAAQGVQGIGRAVQDFAQGGLGGIINNMEQLGVAGAKMVGFSTAVGAAAGGIATLGATAVLIAMPKIKEFIASLSTDKVHEFRGAVERLKDHIKELSERPIKLAVDTAELDAATGRLEKLNAAKAAAKALESELPEAEGKEGKRVHEAIAQHFPGGMKGLRAKMHADPEFMAANAGSGELKEILGIMALMDEQINSGTLDPGEAQGLSGKREDLAEKAQKLRQKIEKDMDLVLDEIVFDATRGNDPAIDKLSKMAKLQAPEFQKHLRGPTKAEEKEARATMERLAAEFARTKGEIGAGAFDQSQDEKRAAAALAKNMAGNRDKLIDKGLGVLQKEDTAAGKDQREARAKRDAAVKAIEAPLEKELMDAFLNRQVKLGKGTTPGLLAPDDLARISGKVADRLAQTMPRDKAHDLAPQVVMEGFKKYQAELEKSQLASGDNDLGFLRLATQLTAGQAREIGFKQMIAARVRQLEVQLQENAMRTQTFQNRGFN